MTIDFTPTVPQETNPVEINFQPGPLLPSASTAAARGYMFQQGLNPVLNIEKEDIDAAIASGKEIDLRKSASSDIDNIKVNLKQSVARILGQMPNPSDQAIAKLAEPLQPTDPRSVAEEGWGQMFTQTMSKAAYGNLKDTDYAQVIKDAPKIVEQVNRAGGIIAAQNQYVTKWGQNAQDAINKQGYVHAASEAATGFFPFYSEGVARSFLNKIVPWTSDIGFGNYMEEVSQKLLSMPFPQFVATMDDVFGPMIEADPHVASDILGRLLNQTTESKILGNLQTAFDVTSVPGFGLATKGIARLAGLAKGVKDVADITADGLTRLKWTGKEPPSLEDIPKGWYAEYKPGTAEWYLITAKRAAEAAGDMKEAGIQGAAKEIKESLDPKADPSKSDVDRLTSNLRLDKNNWVANIGRGGQELANRITDKFNALDSSFKAFLESMVRVETLSDVQAADVTARKIEKIIRENYRGVNNMVGDVKYLGLDKLKNTYRYEIHYMQPDGNPFKMQIQAAANKNLNGLLDAKIVKEGMGFKLVREINLDENLYGISDLLAQTDEARLQGTYFDGWMSAANRYRTPKETLSFDENMQREKATHSPAVLLGLVKKQLSDLQQLPKGLPFTSTRKQWRQFQQAVNHAKYEIDRKTGDPGHWFEDGAAMDKFYLQNFQRLPSDLEKQAYMATVRNIEMNRVLDTIRLYDNKAKWGGEQHRIVYKDKSGKTVDTPFFEGRVERDLDKFNIPADAMVYVKVGNQPATFYRWGGGTNPLLKGIREGRLKAVQVFNPDHRPLAEYESAGQARIQWVISDRFETKPLDWETQIPRRGGGHFVYDYNYYLKQAKVTMDAAGKKALQWLEGDTTVMPISIRLMGEDIAKHMNAVRLHLLEGREEAAEAYHKANKLPFDWDTHRDWYRETHAEGGKYTPARLNLREPIYLVPKDKTVADMPGAYEDMTKRYGKAFRDSAREGNPARQMQVQFTGERDAREVMSIRNKGTRDNPLYEYEPAAFADPIHTMNRAMQRSIKSLYNVDMKNYSMRHWLRQVLPHLDVEGVDKLKTVMNSPSWYFNNPKWLKGTDVDTITKFEQARYQIKQFIGVPSDTEARLHVVMQNMADYLYGKGFRQIPDWMMGDARDPLAYLRSAVVHMKLGLFNIPSFFVQASTHLNIWGIAGPRHAGPGAAAFYFDTLARVNQHPETIAALGKKAEKMGWRPGEWEEAWRELQNRGFYDIGHTHAFVDAPYQNKIIQTKIGQFLDAGHAFFREGARSVRTAAWYTAYHEWRNGASWTKGAHPTGKLTMQEWDRVMARAADLDHNMSRAGNSRIQAGLMSFPMQFQSYHLRLLELMTGKRLSTAEKVRLFAAQSLMYGIPIGGMGIGLPVVGPVITNQMNKHAQENLGYQPNQNFAADVVMRGIPDAMMGLAFGSQYNIGERWGPGKFNPIEQMLNGSQGWWDMVAGATGSTLANIAQSSGPIFKAGWEFIKGTPENFKITPEDMLRPLEEVSSISNIAGFIRTIETGRIYSKQGRYLSDVSKAKWRQALMKYVVGLTPERSVAARDNYEWDKAEQDDYRAREGNIIRELHAYYDALDNNDQSSADDHWKRAFAYAGDMPEKDRIRVWTQAARTRNLPLDKAMEQRRLLKNPPKGKEEQFKRMYQERQEQDNE
jgi:hypothetical protein